LFAHDSPLRISDTSKLSSVEIAVNKTQRSPLITGHVQQIDDLRSARPGHRIPSGIQRPENKELWMSIYDELGVRPIFDATV